jgi:hypothetical protein
MRSSHGIPEKERLVTLTGSRCHESTIVTGSSATNLILITLLYRRGLLSLPGTGLLFRQDLLSNRCLGRTIVAGSRARSRLRLGQLWNSRRLFGRNGCILC